MTVHGMGSVSSPIVISDDEDEAYVELELEQRLSSPQEGMELEFVDDYKPDAWLDPPLYLRDTHYHDEPPLKSALVDVTPNGHQNYGSDRSTFTGQKRKRGDNSVSPSQRLRPLPTHTQPTLASTGAPPGESKTAKKKRRKRERKAAEAIAQAMAGPSTGIVHPLPAMPVMPPPMSSGSPIAPSPMISLPPFPLHTSLPPKPMTYLDFGLPLPHMLLQGAPMSFHPPPPPPPPPPAFLNFHTAAVHPVESSVIFPEQSPSPPTEAEPFRKVPIVKKPIGVPPDNDRSSHHGTYQSPSPTFSPPNPARTLVMELLPKKFRNVAFIRSWAMNFGPQPPVAPRIDLDVKAGKALIEFATAETARLAWESDRLTGEGKEHVRAYWYRVPGIGADAGVGELEEGEIEDGELAKHFGQNNKTKTKESRKKATELAPLVTYSAAPVVQPLSSNGHRTSHPPVTPSSSTFSPVQSSFVTRHPTLPSAPPSLPPKPVSPAQHPPMKLVGLPPPPPHAPQADPPKPLLSRIQPTLSNPQEGAQTVPTPVQSAVSSLNATAPVFVPKAQPLSSASVSNEAAPPRSLDVPSVDKITDTSRSRLESDVSETTLAQTASDHVRVVPKAVREVVAGTIFESDQLSQEADIGPIVSSRDVSTPPAVSSPGGSSSSEAPAISSQPEAPSAAGRSLLPAKLKPDTKSQMQSVLAVSANQEVTIPVAVPSAKPSASSQPRDPRSALSTSTPPPSEPRATRNAPKVPSSAKRKEVEEMLSRHREELASRRSASSSGSTTPVSEIEAMIVGKSLSSTAETTPSPTLPAAVDAAAAIKEDDLRRLVLNSRKSRVVSAAPNTPPVESSPSFVASVTVNELKAAQDKLSLDELAVSFIAQSIQAVSMPSPALGSPDRSAPAVAPIFSEKALLSAKQQVLEGNIADQKALMNRYLAARTKAERDRLKQAMAQRSRAMEQELGTLQARADAGKEAARALKFRWPETNKHACILVISDDEGEDSDD